MYYQSAADSDKGNGKSTDHPGAATQVMTGKSLTFWNAEVMLIGACPECGGAVEHEGGGAICLNCGFTTCS